MTIQELIKDKDYDSLDLSVKNNIKILLERINKLQKYFKDKFKVTSGLRTKEDQIRIYANKGITDIKYIPMGSCHLVGKAVDIYDPKFEITNYCKNNEHILEECQLWCEDDRSVPRLHLQTQSPVSGKRWFKP